MNELKLRNLETNEVFSFNYINNLVGFGLPSIREGIGNLPLSDGSYYYGSLFGSRVLSWRGLLLCDSDNVYEQRINLLKVVNSNALERLEFTTFNGLELMADVKVLKIDMPYTRKHTLYQVEAVAPDFRFYSQEEHNLTTGVTATGGGTPIPTAIPAPIGGVADNPLNIPLIGNTYSNPIFIIQGAGSNFNVVNTTTGEHFNINATITGGEQIIIDTLEKTVKKGSENLYNNFSGDFITLNPLGNGSNRIRFLATGDDAGTSLTVVYRDAYKGV